MTNIKEKIHILKVAVPSPLRSAFDYLPPEDFDIKKIKIGTRVLVPFGRREIVGVVLEINDNSNYDFNKLKPAKEILDDEQLLPKTILSLVDWTADYYNHPIGDVISNVLPTLLRKKPNRKKIEDYKDDFVIPVKTGIQKNQCCSSESDTPIQLNKHQQEAINKISKHLDEFKTFLLDGVTSSGKTEVYLRVLEEVIAQNKQALILVPEINLTPQTISRFAKRFPVEIAVMHSRLTPKERLISWLRAKDGKASIIIGTRSAIFTPLKNPGIIVIDEEHDLSFKQQTGLRYSARDLAVVRGKIENIPVVLGSATPSIESLHNVKRKRYEELKLPERAGVAIHPSFHIVDMRSQKIKNGIADGLLTQIKRHLDEDGQVLIFLNRRGFAPLLICNGCSWTAVCKYCDARMITHQKKNHLRCHHCGSVIRIPVKCPECSEEKLLMLGAGTERIEMALSELFPEANITRIDRDTTKKKNSLEKMLDSIHKGEYQILVGTQMLAKGHHFPNVTMVAVLNVDQSLFSFDFRSSEHLAQLVMQVAGRAGRAEKSGEVYLQTHNPHHPLLLNLINGGYSSFVNNCLEERQAAQMPPYSYLALFQAEAKLQERVFEFLNTLNSKVESKLDKSVKIFGPVPTTMERKANYFRAQLLLQGENRKLLQQAISILLDAVGKIKTPNGLRWFLDVDPAELGG